MFKQEVFDEIFEENPLGEKYYKIDNGYKTWIIPAKNMQMGYGIYQVSSFRGKLVKYILPRLKNIKIIRKLARCEETYLQVSKDVHNVIRKYYKGEYQCSVYYGNLDTEQNYKATIQVYNKKNILFYIKATQSEVVKSAMERETNALKELKQNGFDNIPEVIALESVGKWTFFVQTAKGIHGKTKLKFDEKHWAFLEEILKRTKVKCSYETTDMCDYLNYLEQQLEINPDLSQYKILNSSIEVVKKWLQEDENIYSFAHGDFTPWNMYNAQNDIYVFDFEYCMNRTIPFMDFFHFICQTNLIAYNMNTEKTIKEYRRYKAKLEKYLGDADKAFVGYLLFVISFYIMRKNGDYDTNNKQFQYRIRLLEKLI